MWEGMSRVTISPQAVHKPEPGREASEHKSPTIWFPANGVIGGQVPGVLVAQAFVKAIPVVEVRKNWLNGVQLICHPEVCKGDIGEGGDHDPEEDAHHPLALLVLEGLCRVEEEESIEGQQSERAGKSW